MPRSKRFSREQVRQIIEANDIVEVIGACLDLKRSGARYTTLCPFHQENTPSFSVNPAMQIFHCFGCGKSGDALGFVMEYESLTFLEALQKLADRAGIALALDESGGADDKTFRRKQVQDFLSFAERFFRHVLEESEAGAPARDYLAQRQLKPETVARFGLGCAPPGWNSLVDAAGKKGYDPQVLDESGLVGRSSRGRRYDFFRNRLLFPIWDVAGRTVAFGGRALSSDEKAKYINSPETLLYKKNRALYGLREARDSMRSTGHVLLVEGYFDLLRCFDVGIENVVAPCGTSFTEGQAALLRRFVPEVVVVYDGDRAGVKATMRTMAVLAGAGLSVRAAPLPEGQDPDDFIRAAGADAFRERVTKATDFVSYVVEMNPDRLGDIGGRNELAHEIFAILVAMQDEIRRSEYLKRTARTLELDPWACQREFDRFLRSGRRQSPDQAAEAPAGREYTHEEVVFVAALLADAGRRKQALSAIEAYGPVPGPLADVLAAMAECNGNGDAALAQGLEGAAQALFAAAATMEPPTESVADKKVKEMLRYFAVEAMREEEARLETAIARAEAAGDQAQLMALLAEHTQLKKARSKQ
ncbi:MAG: DNA primase [Candidatus Hydrogenedentota bacterium]